MLSVRNIIGVLILAVCLFHSTHGQRVSLADLESSIDTITNEKEKIDALNNLSYRYFNINANQCVLYAQKALELSEEIGYLKGISAAYNNLGIGSGITANKSKVLQYFSKSYRIAEDIGDSTLMASASNGLAITYTNRGNYDEAIKNYFKSLDLYENLNDQRGQLVTLSQLGHVNVEISQFDKAEDYYIKAVDIVRKNEATRTSLKVWVLSNIASFYEAQNRTILAKKYCNEALFLASEINLKDAISANLNMITSRIEAGENQLVAAKRSAMEAITIAKTIENEKLNIQTQLNYVNILLKAGEAKTALKEANLLVPIVKSNNYREEEIKLYESLTEIYQETGNYKDALQSSTALYAYRDSLALERQKLNISTLEEKFAKEKAIKENESLRLENELKSRTSQIYQIGLGLLAFALLIGFFSYMNNTKIRNEIQSKNNELQVIVDNAQEGITYRDATTRELIFASDLAVKILGADNFEELQKHSIVDFSVYDMLDGRTREEELAYAYDQIKTKGRYANTIRYRGLDGREFWCQLLSVLDNSDKEKPRNITFLRDVTEEYEANQAIERKNNELERVNSDLQKYIESNIQLEQFAHVASHDLRAPVITIKGFAKVLSEKASHKLDEKEKGYLDYIRNNAEQMFELVNDLLDYSKINSQAINLNTFDVNTLVSNVIATVESQAKEKKVDIVVDPTLPEIVADEIKIKRVFQNLITNAIKFSDNKKDSFIHIKYQNGKNHQFTVEDNGIGIKDSDVNIFQPYVQLNNKSEYKGTGLGLSICEKIVSQHGGKIFFDSEFGKGTTFTFTIEKRKP